MPPAGVPNLRHPHRFRGDVNAALNRLLAEGVIAGYRTNLTGRERPERLEVTITPCTDEVRERVQRALSPLHHDVLVTTGDEGPRAGRWSES